MRGDQEKATFDGYLHGRIPPRMYARLALQAVFDPFHMVLRTMPGPLGYQLRRWYYGFRLGALGKGALIDYGVQIRGPENLYVGDYAWIDTNCLISAVGGRIEIGRRVHIGTTSIINSHELVEIGDYVGISHGVKIFGRSESPGEGQRISGPMVLGSRQVCGRIHIKRDAFLGANSIVFPGVTLGEGAVVGAASVVTKDVPPWTIVVGAPARPVGTRDKVTVPDC